MPRLFALCLAYALFPATAHATGSPWSEAAFGFEPRLGTYTALDASLTEYGYAPVRSAVLPAFGLRARYSWGKGIYLPMEMTYAFLSNQAEGNPVPTTTTLIETGAGVGYRAGNGLYADGVFGFGVTSHSVGSRVDGGALVYMGPTVHPRVGWAFTLDAPTSPVFAVSVGYALHLPVGAAHHNVLWEASFDRPAVHALTVGLESGFRLRGGE